MTDGKKSRLIVKAFLLSFASALITTVFSTLFACNAAVEVGENYVMLDFREYDGDSSIVYGKGSNAKCYYPMGDNTEYVFPEVYTWDRGTLTETESGVLLKGKNVGEMVGTTIDKMPAVFLQSIQRNFKYLVLRLKANNSGESTIVYSSAGTSYKKRFPVTYSGEWQSVVLDLSGKDGWLVKSGDNYIEATGAPWDNAYISPSVFGLNYEAIRSDAANEFLIDYYAFTDDPSIILSTGKVETVEAYIKGSDDGNFFPNEKLTRLQAAIITCRLLGFPDESLTLPEEYVSRFDDVSEEHYGAKYIAALERLGILSRYGTSFFPERNITIGELCSMLVMSRVLSRDLSENTSSALTDSGREITRAEACAVINSLTGRNTSLDFSYDRFPDITPQSPFFRDVLSASMSADIKTFSDGSIKTLSVYDEPDFEKTQEVLSEIDKRASEMYKAIHQSPTEIVGGEKCYYVSPNGDDSNSGTDPSSPWKTLKKVNAVGFTAGSTVFFERGGLWRGSLKILPSVTYTAYGEGEKPTIYGSLYDGADEDLWTLVEGTDNIWRFKYDMLDSGSVVFNHGEFHSYKETPTYKDSTYYHRNSSKVFDFKTDIRYDLGIFCDNKKELTKDCALYMRCDKGNPGKLFDSIEFMPRQNIMSVTANKDAVIDNFCLKYGGAHGIGAGTLTGFTVTNCEFHWIGGSVHTYSSGGGTMAVRYGNAIESYGAPNGFLVENNYIYQVYDAGITHQMSGGTQQNGVQKNIRYANNLIEYCSYSIEYFLGQGESGTPERYMENIVIENNIMRYAGFGFGNQRTDRLCMSHIKSGSSPNKVSDGFVIRNNIFDRSREMLLNIGAETDHDLPILSGNTYIQYETKRETSYSTFGKYGTHPARLQFFSKDINNILKDRLVDEGASVYLAERDWLYDLIEY